MRRSRERVPLLRVDRVACTGHGVCAALLEDVALDTWGYPIVGDPVAAAASPDVRSALSLCPARALYLTERT